MGVQKVGEYGERREKKKRKKKNSQSEDERTKEGKDELQMQRKGNQLSAASSMAKT